eukprot:5222879-Amphidinium_carterae.1
MSLMMPELLVLTVVLLATCFERKVQATLGYTRPSNVATTFTHVDFTRVECCSLVPRGYHCKLLHPSCAQVHEFAPA